MTTDAEWAWVAGVIEGEGWIDTRHGGVTVEMTDEDVVRKLFSITGGMGTFIGPRRTYGGDKPKYIWGVRQRDEFLTICEKLLPWLGQRRSAAMLVAIEVAKQKRSRKKWCFQNRGRTENDDAYVKTAA